MTKNHQIIKFFDYKIGKSRQSEDILKTLQRTSDVDKVFKMNLVLENESNAD